VTFFFAFVVGNLASFANQLSLFNPKHLKKTNSCLLLLKAQCSLINKNIYDIRDFLQFQAYGVKAKNYFSVT